MEGVIWGSFAALFLGGADFAGRFSGCALGAPSAMLGVVAVGSVVLTFAVLGGGEFPPLAPAGLLLIVGYGVSTAIMGVLLYAALARGPVSVVAPIVASHPVLIAAYWYSQGVRPDAIQWAAIVGTILGVMLVALSHEQEGNGEERRARGALHVTLVIAAGACLAHAVLVIAAQAATPCYEPLQIAWMGRIVSFFTLLGYFAVLRQRPNVHGRWWQFLIAQGLMDAAGHYCLFVGSRSDSVTASVATSAFGAVTTLLAWLVLREAMGRIQWLGVVLVFAGIGVLAARG
jgi:drug/metabolite transporter (DMT)-like permease